MRLRGGGSAGITKQRLPVFLTGRDARVCRDWMSSRPNHDVQAERNVQERGKCEIRGGRKLEHSVIKEMLAPESGFALCAFVASASRLAPFLGSDWFLLLSSKISLIKLTFRPKQEGFQICATFL